MIKIGFDGNELFITETEEKRPKKLRPHKGKSLIEFPEKFTVIDLETTGLDHYYDSIIECGALRVRNNKVVDAFDELIFHKELDDFITQLTGITPEMLKRARPEVDVIRDYLDFIKDDTILGFNVNFDINFLYDTSERLFHIPFSNNFIDVMRIFRKVTPDDSHHRLKDLKARYSINENAHRALDDCWSTLKGYSALQNDIVKDFKSTENFIKKEFSHKPELKAKDIQVNKQATATHPLYGKSVTFTGTLTKYPRRQAWQIVANLGGYPCDRITKKTDFLVVGIQDPDKIIGNKSRKQMKAEELILNGTNIRILSENTFYKLISNPDEMKELF